MGRGTTRKTSKLIEEVARGDRVLEDIADPQLRETVRLALRLYRDPHSGPDAATRARIRSRVFRSLAPRPATFADRIAVALDVLARPTPYAMRALSLSLAVICAIASTSVVSADAVATDPLYSMKIASEQVRVALATTPADRAVVELSIAEHRLAEATAHAAIGNDDDAIVASSEYGEHMALAAAELAQVESFAPESALLVTQLQQRIAEHRVHAASVVARLENNPATAGAAAVLALLATPAAPAADLSRAAAIAADAAHAADRVAEAAERIAAAVPAAPRMAETPAVAEVPVSAAQRIATTGEALRGGDRPRRNERAAEIARKAAEQAKAAANKARASWRLFAPTPGRNGEIDLEEDDDD